MPPWHPAMYNPSFMCSPTMSKPYRYMTSAGDASPLHVISRTMVGVIQAKRRAMHGLRQVQPVYEYCCAR